MHKYKKKSLVIVKRVHNHLFLFLHLPESVVKFIIFFGHEIPELGDGFTAFSEAFVKRGVQRRLSFRLAASLEYHIFGVDALGYLVQQGLQL
jgi:hypothetical protein